MVLNINLCDYCAKVKWLRHDLFHGAWITQNDLDEPSLCKKILKTIVCCWNILSCLHLILDQLRLQRVYMQNEYVWELYKKKNLRFFSWFLIVGIYSKCRNTDFGTLFAKLDVERLSDDPLSDLPTPIQSTPAANIDVHGYLSAAHGATSQSQQISEWP